MLARLESTSGSLFELALLGWLFRLALWVSNLLFLGPFRVIWRSHPRRKLVSYKDIISSRIDLMFVCIYVYGDPRYYKHVIFESIHPIFVSSVGPISVG